MKHYFLEVGSPQAKNKAQEEMQTYVYKFASTLCDEVELKVILAKITTKASILNETFTRCKNIKVNMNEYSIDTGLSISGETVSYEPIFSINCTQIKRYELSKPIES